MTIRDTIKHGFHIALTNKSLWLFGFFLGLGSSGSSGGSPAGLPAGGGVTEGGYVVPVIALVVAIVAVGLAMRVLSEGALIEGVRRAWRGERGSVREGFSAGWAHWGTILLIDVIYVLVTLISIAVLATPSLLAALNPDALPATVILGILAALVGIPWLVTLYMWQAFATRIAVLENRRAGDAIRKARLFLHGRLWRGLELLMASLLGTILAAVGALLVLALLFLLVATIYELGGGPTAIVLGLPVIVPAVAFAIAIIGTFRSSVWTIGYLTELEREPVGG